MAFQGWLVGFDGQFEFENIGDSYIENKVPYVGMRTLPALLGSAIPAVVYAIMRESGYPRIVGLFSASLVLFGGFFSGLTRAPNGIEPLLPSTDNAHVGQTRLILLDAPMILFMALAFYSYIRFYKLRYSCAVFFPSPLSLARTKSSTDPYVIFNSEFTRPWWTWMTLTGVFLSLTISCKMVGLFAFLSVGTAVAVDLWNLLDVKRGLTIVSSWSETSALPVRTLTVIVNPDRNNSTATLPPAPSASSWSRRWSTSSGSGCTLPS